MSGMSSPILPRGCGSVFETILLQIAKREHCFSPLPILSHPNNPSGCTPGSHAWVRRMRKKSKQASTDIKPCRINPIKCGKQSKPDGFLVYSLILILSSQPLRSHKKIVKFGDGNDSAVLPGRFHGRISSRLRQGNRKSWEY